MRYNFWQVVNIEQKEYRTQYRTLGYSTLDFFPCRTMLTSIFVQNDSLVSSSQVSKFMNVLMWGHCSHHNYIFGCGMMTTSSQVLVQNGLFENIFLCTWYWNLLAKYSYDTQGNDQTYILVSHRNWPSCFQFYPWLVHLHSEQWHHYH
jgi:hypothetical protein